jgi:hypothetical protein
VAMQRRARALTRIGRMRKEDLNKARACKSGIGHFGGSCVFIEIVVLVEMSLEEGGGCEGDDKQYQVV